jgi:hypothetical protein
MNPSVLLLHELPDGSSHYDWMIQRPAKAAGLITFRVLERIDREGAVHFSAVRLPDHRAEYLTYEGAVSRNRGRVSRVAEGRLEIEVDVHGHFRAAGELGERRGAFDGKLQGDGSWGFTFRPRR